MTLKLRYRQTVWVERGIYARGMRAGPPRYGISYTIPAHVAQKYGVPRRRRELAGHKVGSARRLLGRRKNQIWEGDFSFLEPPPESMPTLRQFASRYLEYAQATKKSWTFDQARLRAFLISNGSRHLDAIRQADVDQHKAARAREVGPRTVNHELQVIHALFATAVRWKALSANPAEGVKRLRVPKKAIRVLSSDEEERILAVAHPHLRDLIVLILHTGLRRGEALAIRRRHVDLESRVLTVAAGKGDKARFVPLNDTAAEIMARRARGRTDYLFTWKRGREPERAILDVKTAWQKALKKSGVRGITIHNLRDTFATRAVHLGVNLVTLRDLLGHTTIEMTVKYAHPTPEENRRAVGLLEASFGRKPSTKVAPGGGASGSPESRK